MSDEIRCRVAADVDIHDENYQNISSTNHAVMFSIERDEGKSAMYQLGVQFARIAEAIEVHLDGTYDDLIDGFSDWLEAR